MDVSFGHVSICIIMLSAPPRFGPTLLFLHIIHLAKHKLSRRKEKDDAPRRLGLFEIGFD